MLTAMLITLREGLEAALVIAVVASFLSRTGEAAARRFVWLGSALAGLLSLGAGAGLFLLAGEMSDETGEAFGTAVTLIAVGVLTYMVLWMRRHGAGVKNELEEKVIRAAKAASPLALTLLAFTAVSREGLETVLFLFASSSTSGTAATVTGGVAGLLLAAAVGAGIYRGSSRLNMKTFFSLTGVLLIVLAAGVLGNALGELTDGLPGFFARPLWNAGNWLGDGSGAGALLKSLLGYSSSPPLAQVLGYGLYLVTMLWLYLRPRRQRQNLNPVAATETD